jgi:hypothetical protein
LKRVIEGQERGECRLRNGDELQDLCELINRATEPIRGAAKDGPAETKAREAA